MTLVLAAFAWGLAEATVFFLVPDVLVAAASAHRPESGVAFALAALAGSLVGGVVTYLVSRWKPRAVLGFVEWLPGHTPAYVALVRQDTRLGGIGALATAAFVGRQFKILAYEAATSGRPGFVAFFGVTGLSRAARFSLAAFLGTQVPLAGTAPAGLAVLAVALALSAAFLAFVEARYRRSSGDDSR